MKAAVLYSPRNIKIEERPVPKIKADEVLVKMKNVGICRSDVWFYMHGRIGFFKVNEPIVLGHECCGEIVDRGDSVKNLATGDRVVIEPGIPCGKCFYCRIGRYELCLTEKFMGAPPTDGAYQEYVAWPSDLVFKMPDEMSFEEGAMVEPLAVGLTAIKIAGGISAGSSVAIIGSGTIGLATLLATKESGATDIFLVSRSKHKLDLAERFGAKMAINSKEVEPSKIVKDMTGGLGADIVFDSVGTEDTINQAFKLVRDGGRIHEIGLGFNDTTPIPMIDILLRELVLTGHNKYANIFPSAIKLASSRKLPLKLMLTHLFKLEDISKAMEMVEKGADKVIKAQIKFD
jgi:L-iditol 2-dehydrogenase